MSMACRLHQPRLVDYRSIDSEAALASRWDSAVAAPLTDLVRRLAGGDKAEWTQQPPSRIIQDAMQFTTQVCISQPSHQLHEQEEVSRFGRPLRAPVRQQDAASPPSDSGKRKMDFVLMLPASAESASIKRRCICVGEVKRASVLVDASMSPADLIEAWQGTQHPLHGRASAVISQVFTYMQFWKLCYGFITCWVGTWLVYCPAHKRDTLYLSSPILNSAAGPEPTARGAVAWLQAVALAHESQAVDIHPGMQAVSAADSGDRTAGGAGAGEEAPDDTSQSRDATSGSDYRPSHSGGSSDVQQLSEKRVSGQAVHLYGKLCQGSDGAVVVGKCRGQRAVVKLLGPDASGLSAFRRELDAYGLLQSEQGRVVPHLLAAGHLVAGVHAIATAWVMGTPLSSLKTIPESVVQAARSALERVHSACPGLCHGDVRLQNVMLVQQDVGWASCMDPPKVMILDFGRARRGCSRQQQRGEVEQLISLMEAVI